MKTDGNRDAGKGAIYGVGYKVSCKYMMNIRKEIKFLNF